MNELHSFQFCEDVDGTEHDYRITQESVHLFKVEKDGILIAGLTFDNQWKQLSGEPLNPALLQQIGHRINQHFSA